MAKKTTTPHTTEPKKLTAAAKPIVEAAIKPSATKETPAKAPAKAKAAAIKVKASAVTGSGSAVASITPADIALRAYFIAEKRQKLGLAGDSTNDWVEAESQLQAEAALKA